MQIRDFSERVLFGATLADKLVEPGRFDDDVPGVAIATPAGPSRPVGLRLEDQASRAKIPFPKLHELEHDKRRGHLFHFFANHELLALELMALALLKLPDAPSAFRLGIAHTMVEEQTHLRLYLERMHSCGVELGEIPLNGYFWRCSAAMTSPMDYVTQLSMTFEQANLDYCLHYRAAFDTLGDADAVAVLDRICDDEVGHLKFGLKWFDRWKEATAQESDFDVYQRYLKPPLTAVRAKGFSFNREARVRAGLSEAFIDELHVFSTSRGRPPDVYSYNPDGEDDAGKRDLASLPMFTATSDDVVVVHTKPRPEFLAPLQRLGFAVPEFVEVAEPTRPLIMHALDQRRLGKHRPWSSWRGPYSDAACASINDTFVAGHFADWVESPTLADWVGTDVCRLAVAFTVHANAPATIHGITRFVTDQQGNYLGSFLGKTSATLGGQLARLAHGDGRTPGRLFDYLKTAAQFTATALAKTGYEGPAAIDATVYGRSLVPIARVYPRMTMGRIALEMTRRLERGHVGMWTIVRRPDITSFAADMEQRFPADIVTQHGGTAMRSGVLFTTDPVLARACATAIVAGRTWQDCTEPLTEFSRQQLMP